MFSTKPSKPRTRIGITTRLVAFYLVSTLVILFCTNWFQFQALSDDLAFEDADFLVERLSALRHAIARDPDTASVLKDQIPSSDSEQHLRYLVRVQDGQGRTILESPGMSGLPFGLFPPPLSAREKVGHGIKYRRGDGRRYLLNSAWAEGFGEPHFRLVQIALDISDEDALIAKYQLKMVLSVLVGLLLAGALGYLLTRKGLRPLESMASKVADRKSVV